MKKILIAVAILIVVLLAGAIVAPFLIPVDQYKSRIIAEVKQRTGRDLRINGPIEVSVLPNLTIQLNDVGFAEGPSADAPNMLELRRLDLRMALVPLLKGEVEISRFVLDSPRISLAVDAQGNANWDFQTGAPARQGDTTTRTADGSSGDAQGSSPLSDLRLGDVRIVNGTISYADARNDTRYVVEDVDLAIALPDLDSPLDADGDVTYKGKRLSIDTSLAEPRSVIAGNASALTLSVGSDVFSTAFDGSVDVGASTASGQVTVETPALPAFVEWATGEAVAIPVERLRFSGVVTGSSAQAIVRQAEILVDDVTATGDITLALAGARPKLSAVLDVGRIDVDRYLDKSDGGDPVTTASQPATSQTPSRTASGPTASSEGWSEEPIDLGGLKLIDANLRLVIAGLTVSAVDIGATTLAATLDDGKLTADLGQTALFDGTVAAKAAADASAATPNLSLDLQINSVQAEPLLTRFADFERLSGSTRASISIRTAGKSQKDMIEALDGTATLVFTDGAIRGVNLAQIVRNVTGTAAGGEEPPRTDFAELSGTFAINDGIAVNDDLKLLAPLLRLEGAGQVSLPTRQVDFRLMPRLVASIEGQGGAEGLRGIRVPVLVRGTFDDIRFAPDLAGIAEEALRDPDAVRDQIRQLEDAVKSGQAEEQVRGVLEGLIGGGGQAPTGDGAEESATQPAQPANPVDALRGILGR